MAGAPIASHEPDDHYAACPGLRKSTALKQLPTNHMPSLIATNETKPNRINTRQNSSDSKLGN